MKKIKIISALITAFIFISVAAFASSNLEKMIVGKWSTHGGWVKNYGSELIFKENHTIWSSKRGEYVAHWKVVSGSKPVIQIDSWKHIQKIKYDVRQKGSHLYLYWHTSNKPDLIKRGSVSGSINSGSGNNNSGAVSGNIKRTGPFAGFTGYWVPLHKNGKEARRVPFVNGQKHGTGHWYYESGFVHYKTGWVSGKPHGVETEYYNMPGKKKKCTITYNNGMKDGWEYRYSAQGRKIKSILWKSNKKVKEQNH